MNPPAWRQLSLMPKFSFPGNLGGYNLEESRVNSRWKAVKSTGSSRRILPRAGRRHFNTLSVSSAQSEMNNKKRMCN
ncbi:hypothetical protein SUGI_0113580 [Cryptomeria japonica]|nr:hypothetical protein SUGI_0113580 [Cryptomeria japonica]